MVCISTENQNQTSFSFYRRRKISVLSELVLEHLRYCLQMCRPSQTPQLTMLITESRVNRRRHEPHAADVGIAAVCFPSRFTGAEKSVKKESAAPPTAHERETLVLLKN